MSAIAADRRRAATRTAHAVTAASAAALDHGFQTALYVLVGLLVVGAIVSITMVKPAAPPRPAAVEEDLALERAA